jgi:hypothetical protein
MLSYTLENIINQLGRMFTLYKSQLRPGDRLYLKTCNSLYSIQVVDDGHYLVSGGWFDKHNLSPFRIKISGCTFGGSIIKTDIIAAPGLRLEFENRLVTSPVQKIFLFPVYSIN